MSVEFLVSLRERVSSPALQAVASLRTLASSLGTVGEASEALSSVASRVGSSMGGMAGGLLEEFKASASAIQVVEQVLGKVGDVAAAVISKVYEAGKAFTSAAIDAADFKDSSLLAFETLLKGSKDGTNAAGLLQQAIEFAGKTPFKTDQIVAGYKTLLTGGFKADAIQDILKGVGDLAALKGDPGVINQLTASLSKLQSTGKLTGESVQQFAEAGVNAGALYETLGKQLGKPRSEIEKLISAGKIDAAAGVKAILETMKTTTSGGELGSLMKKKAETWGGLVSTLQSRPLEMLMDINASPAYAALKGVLSNLVDALGSDSPSGKALKTSFGELFSAMFGGLDDLGSKGGKDLIGQVITKIAEGISQVAAIITAVRPAVGAFLDTFLEIGGSARNALAPMLSLLGRLIPSFGEAGSTAKLIGQALAYAAAGVVALAAVVGVAAGVVVSVFGGAVAIVTSFTASILAAGVSALSFGAMVLDGLLSIPGLIAGALGQLLDLGTSAGSDLATGLANGITSGISAVIEAARGVAQGAISAVTGTLIIRSPSHVMAELGEHTSAGFAQGIDSGAGDVDVAMRSMVAPPDAGGGGSGGRRGGGGITVNAPITINAPGAAPGVAEELGDAIEEKLTAWWEGIERELGLGPAPEPAT